MVGLARPSTSAPQCAVKSNPFAVTDEIQNQYDDAVFAYTTGDYDGAAAGFASVLAADPRHFEAQLSLGMAYYRMEDFARAIAEGKKAETMNPHEQRVHTNLSLAYMRSGDKETAEHHGLQAKLAGWRGNMDSPDAVDENALKMSEPKLDNIKMPPKFPDQPWKKKKD